MTDYEYILKQAKFFHYKGWEEGELRKCVNMLANLSRQELVLLYQSRWVHDGGLIKRAIFNILFVNKIGQREDHIRVMDTAGLIAEFLDKQSGNFSLIRKELRERYKAGRDRQLIVMAFNSATKSDQQWVKWQIRKEQFGNTNGYNNYQWKKKPW